MIVQGAAELTMLAAELVVLRRSQKHGESLASRRQRIDSLLAKLLAAVGACDALAGRLKEGVTQSPLFDEALKNIASWRSLLDDDLSEALSGDNFQTLYDSLERVLSEIDKRTVALWRRYSAQTTPSTSDEILAVLATDPRARPAVMRINRHAETIRRLRVRPFPTIVELNQFDVAAAEMKEAWSTLDTAGLNEEVVSFLRAANGEGGAPIALLTQVVTQWLEQRGAVSSYVIRPAD